VTGPLGRLAQLRHTKSGRASSWDRTGGNRDFVVIDPGSTVSIALLAEPGTIRHIWMTAGCDDELFLRKVVFRAYWDGEESPSVEVPLGDFFGLGHARSRNFWSLPLQMSPEDGRGFNCWFPMPFSSARLTVENEAVDQVTLYFYVDYELDDLGAEDVSEGRFHAQWRRQNPCNGVDPTLMSNGEYLSGGENLSGDENYVILEAEGHGHYVGCNLNIENLRSVGIDVFNWYGEGDDMIFVDGEVFPPALHGTGTEDYFNTAYSPSEAYSSPYHGIILPGGRNWSGQISLYRFHIEDPVRFQRSIRVTIEHGHANRRSDDYSSTAYWYQSEPHAAFPTLLPVLARLPRITTAFSTSSN
jgi:Protein of unknown function (DUF2961)